MYNRKIISAGIALLIIAAFTISYIGNVYAQEEGQQEEGITGDKVFDSGYAYGLQVTLKQGETKTVSIPIEVPSGYDRDQFFGSLAVQKTAGPAWVKLNGIVGGSIQIVVGPHTFGGNISGDQEYSAAFSIGSERGSSGASIALTVTVLDEVSFTCKNAEVWVASLYGLDFPKCFKGCDGCTVEVKEKPGWLKFKYGGTYLQGRPKKENVGDHTVRLEAKKKDKQKGEGSINIKVKKPECGDTFGENSCTTGTLYPGSHTECPASAGKDDKETWKCYSGNSAGTPIVCEAKCAVDGECGAGGRDASGSIINKCSAGKPKTVNTSNNTTFACYCNASGGTHSAGETWQCLGENGGEDSPLCPTENEDCIDGEKSFAGKCGVCSCVCAYPTNITGATYQCAGYSGGSTTTCPKPRSGCQIVSSGAPPAITITTTEGATELSENEIYNSGYRVESVTFTASANIQNPDWQYWYLAESQTCTKSANTKWGSGIRENVATLDEKGDNGYYICFGVKGGTEGPVYKGIKYRLKIGPRVGNNITLAPGAPSAPGLFLSGKTEPGATVEVVSVTNNRVGILQGDTNPTDVADADGNWSLRIVNAIFPKVKNNITIKVKTDDGFREPLEDTVTTTVGEDGVITGTKVTPEGGSTPPGNRQRPGDIHATTEETAPGAPSLFLPPALQRPAPTPPPFTITAEPTTITEGEEITWTITRTEDATEQNATVSCREQGAWGAKPLKKDTITITAANDTESFTMETEDDEVLEKNGTITCFVGAKSNPAVASKSFFVRVKSNDRATESSLIIDCTFGKEKYAFDTGEHKAGDFKEQCGIKHLFQLANNIIKWLIWLALVGAGALIFFKGVKLATNVFDKGGHQEARKGVQDALKATLIGLIVILGAYLIVKAGFDIIGYNLNGGDPFKWDESALPAPDVSQLAPETPPQTKSDTQDQQTTETPPQTPAAEPQQNTQGETEIGQCAQKGGGTAQCACVNCKELNHPDITIKNNRKMHTDLVTKLSNLKNNTKDIEWVITEAWPTTSGHNANCHYVGTCVDIDFAKASPTDEEIERFIIVARSVGLRAVWETRDKERVETLRGRKDITNKNVENYSVPDHFSVYDCRLPSAPRKACS